MLQFKLQSARRQEEFKRNMLVKLVRIRNLEMDGSAKNKTKQCTDIKTYMKSQH